MKADFLQNNFTNGEISPNCLGRFDLAKYLNSAKIVENFFLKQLGGASYRPGTRFVLETKTSSLRSRLLKFQYSTTQSYVIEAGNLYFRFFADGGVLETNDSNTKLLLHFDGADASTTFSDSSSQAHANGTAVGNAQIDTAQSKFGTGSGLFDGTGDRVTFTDSADWDLGSGDFTIEAFVRLNNITGNNMIVGRDTSANSYMYFGFEAATLRFVDFDASSYVIDVSAGVAISTNTWYHVAITREGNNFKLWLDGVQQGATVVDTSPMTDRAVTLDIGAMTENASYVMNGWIDEFRLTKGEARYTDDFTPATSADDDLIPVEVTTVYPTADLNKIKYAQNADTMYIATGTYPVYKLQRTSATVFTMTEVSFVRGPFLDTNIASTTITASSATGATTLTASASIFQSGHVGSYWRVKDGVVKITGYSSGTSVTGTVQAEPDGTAGNLGSTSAETDWAEGAWSAVRGYPKCVTFHEGRLWFANTDYEVDGVWGSVTFEYENHEEGADDDNAININLNADTVVASKWLSSSAKGLQAGTTGGLFNISGGSANQPITPSNRNSRRENIFATADLQARRLFNYAYYVQNDKRRFLESGYFFDIDQTDAVDTTMLADHILSVIPAEDNIFLRGINELGGAYDFDAQQSPNNRIWIVRDDGQMAILTRNVRQEVNGWFRITAGMTVSCDGKSGTGQFESISIIAREGYPDQVWVIVNRLINGESKRFVEYFTDEDFKFDWDPVRLDCSLTLDSPITITDIVFLDDNVVIVAPAHGLSNGDQVKLDNIVGTHQLNGNTYLVKEASTDTFKLDPIT